MPPFLARDNVLCLISVTEAVVGVVVESQLGLFDSRIVSRNTSGWVEKIRSPL